MGDAFSNSIVSFLLGILSIIYILAGAVFMTYFGLCTGVVLGTMGIYFSNLSRKDIPPPPPNTYWLAMAGKICSIFGIALNLLLILAVLWFSYFGFT